MTEFKFHKLVGQVVCTVHDDNGDVIGERVVGEIAAFPAQLDRVPADVVACVAAVNTEAKAAEDPPPPNRAARRTKKPAAKKP